MIQPFKWSKKKYINLYFTKLARPIENHTFYDYLYPFNYTGNFEFRMIDSIPNFFEIENIENQKIHFNPYKKFDCKNKTDYDYDLKINENENSNDSDIFNRNKSRKFQFLYATPENYIFSYLKRNLNFYNVQIDKNKYFFNNQHLFKGISYNEFVINTAFYEDISNIFVHKNNLYIGFREFIFCLRIKPRNRETELENEDESAVNNELENEDVGEGDNELENKNDNEVINEVIDSKEEKNEEINRILNLENFESLKENDILEENNMKEENKKRKMNDSEEKNKNLKINKETKINDSEENDILDKKNNVEEKTRNIVRDFSFFSRKNTTFCINSVGEVAIIFYNKFYLYSRAKLLIYKIKFDKNVDFILPAPHIREFYLIVRRNFYILDLKNLSLKNLCYFNATPLEVKKWEKGLIFLMYNCVHFYDRENFINQDSIKTFYHSCFTPKIDVNYSFFIIHNPDGTFYFFDKNNFSCLKLKFKFENYEGFFTKNNFYIFFFKNYILSFTGNLINFDLQKKIKEFLIEHERDSSKINFKYKNFEIIIRKIKNYYPLPKKLRITGIKQNYRNYIKIKEKRINMIKSPLFDRFNKNEFFF